MARTVRTKVYKFNELGESAQCKALLDYVNFLIEFDVITEDSVFWPAVIKMDKLQTPWFLGDTLFHEYRQELIDGIELNGWEYFENGIIIPAEFIKYEKQVKENWQDQINIDTAIRISKES